MIFADEPFLAGDLGSRWLVRTVPARGWRRYTDRTLAQAETVTPEGHPYSVRIVRNLPLVRSPLGTLDHFLPEQVSLAALIVANVSNRGRTGWSVQVVRPRTAWRARRVVYSRRHRVPAEVVDRAVSLVEDIARGYRPWDEDDPTLTDRIRQTMNWE